MPGTLLWGEKGCSEGAARPRQGEPHGVPKGLPGGSAQTWQPAWEPSRPGRMPVRARLQCRDGHRVPLSHPLSQHKPLSCTHSPPTSPPPPLYPSMQAQGADREALTTSPSCSIHHPGSWGEKRDWQPRAGSARSRASPAARDEPLAEMGYGSEHATHLGWPGPAGFPGKARGNA